MTSHSPFVLPRLDAALSSTLERLVVTATELAYIKYAIEVDMRGYLAGLRSLLLLAIYQPNGR